MGLIKEFKEFAFKGNVMDMAIGVIIGGAFKTIVDALTTSFINPLIASAGGADIAGLIKLPWVDYAGMTLEDRTALCLNYGAFITAVINFFILALVLFAIVKSVNAASKAGEKVKKKVVGKDGKVEEVVEEAPAEPSDEVKLLTEIKDLLAANASK